MATFRKNSGKDKLPRVVVVTNSLEIDPGIPLFASELHSPILLTSKSSPLDKRESLAKRYDVVLSGEDRVDFKKAINALTKGK
jgi:riboflavin biosynthesis pyrimidine reductase